jgi:hypothetical protein
MANPLLMCNHHFGNNGVRDMLKGCHGMCVSQMQSSVILSLLFFS